MKKLIIALTALSIVTASALFAAEECKKCSGADKNAECTCKDKACDKEKDQKACCTKDETAGKDCEKKDCDKKQTETKK